MNQYEQINAYLAEGNSKKAEELFHNLIVGLSRGIMESMESEEELENDSIGGDASDDLISDISTDEDDQEMRNMEEATEEPKTKKSSPYKSNVVPNTAKLVPAPQPNNKQAENTNNLTPFPKVN